MLKPSVQVLNKCEPAILAALAVIGLALVVLASNLPLHVLLGVVTGVIFLGIALVDLPNATLLLFFLSQFATLFTKMVNDRRIYYITFLVPWLLTFLVILRVLSGKRGVPRAALNAPICTFLAVLVIQVFNPRTPSLMGAFNGFASIYTPLVMYFVALYTLENKRHLRRFLLVATLSGVIASIYGLSQEFIGRLPFEDAWGFIMGAHGYAPELTSMHRRVSSLTFYSATNALYLVICFFLTMPLLYTATWRQRLGYFVALLLMLATLVLTLTRGVWLAWVGAMLFLLAATRQARLLSLFRKLQRLLYPPLLVGLIAAVLLAASVLVQSNFLLSVSEGGGPLQRFASIFIDSTYSGGGAVATRMRGWLYFLQVLDGQSVLTGYGLGTVGAGGQRYREISLFILPLTDNYYLTLIVSTGTSGLLVFLWILASAAWHGLKGRRYSDPLIRSTALSIVTILLAFSLAFLTGDYLDTYPPNLYFWFLLGVLMKLRLIQARG